MIVRALAPAAALLAALLGGCAASRDAAPAYDLAIRNGRVLDGTGAAATPGDVAIRDGRIAAVGRFPGRAREEIDAAGQIVAPGFIDVHTHTEDIAEMPLAENFLRMGVTTVVSGNCGSSPVDIAGFFAEAMRARTAINIGTLIGHGSLRAHVMGGSFARQPTGPELAQMRALVDQAMRDGALGLSTGLIYLPGIHARTDEIVALAKVVAKHGGLYASHMRHENALIFGALDELLTVSREARVPVQVSHLKLSSPAAWGRASEVIALLDRARAEGLVIAQDQYAYTAASTGIASLVPTEARAGGTKGFVTRIADPIRKAGIVAEMKRGLERNGRRDYSHAVIASYPPDPRLNGRTVPDAARLVRGADSLDDQIEVVLAIVANGGAQGVFHGIDEEDLRRFMTLPHTMIASDSGVRRFGEGVPHPRGYGNNARVLARYVRELKLLALEEAVRKMTSLPARTFKLANRGELRPGFIADVVVFDPDTVADVARYDDPHHYAVGFSDVVVNGVPVIRHGRLTDARPGKPVRRGD